ncbi:protein translocase subunit SecF [Methyloparacoccus murrellii]
MVERTTPVQPFHIDFMGKRGLWVTISAILSLAAIVSLFARGLNYAVDFTGGTVIEAAFGNPVDLPDLRVRLEKAGFDNPTVQNFGSSKEVLIRLAPQGNVTNQEIRPRVLGAINEGSSNRADINRIEFVGPQVGDDLAEGAILALIMATLGILVYVAWRFEWRFSAGAILATLHDIVMIVGIFALFQWEFDLSVLAAVLAIMGYSLNDTIVVFDRIRENFRKIRRSDTIEVVNLSINETLSRTLMTSFLTLLTVIAMAIWGGDVIHNFALALIIGIVVGTYSSIYVASALAVRLGISRADMLVPEKEGAADGRP